MKATEFFPPYFKKNKIDKCSLKNEFTTASGCYLIKKNNEVVYVGQSGNNLYRTIYRHFQEWNENGKKRITYKKYGCTIRVIKTTAAQAKRLERYLINKFKPKDNELTYDVFENESLSEIGKLNSFFNGTDYLVDEYEF